MESTHGQYRISDVQSELDVSAVKRLLWAVYWADQRSAADIEMSIEHSICFGLYKGWEQVGFARAVTDFSTVSWICDVVIDPAHRGHGLGKWLVETVIAHPSLQRGKQLLATRDAHSLYERHGFAPFPCLIRFVEGSQQVPGMTNNPP